MLPLQVVALTSCRMFFGRGKLFRKFLLSSAHLYRNQKQSDMPPRYYPRNRKPQNEAIIPVSFKKPLELRPAVLGSGVRERGQVCLYELSLLLACFKKTNYSQVACSTEIGNFQKCFYLAKPQMQHEKKGKQKEAAPKNEVNALLKKYSS